MHLHAALAILAAAFVAPLRAPGEHVVRGTLVLADALGSRQPVPKGSITFWYGASSPERIDARVEEGRFELVLPGPEGSLHVGPIDAGGVACWALPEWSGVLASTSADLVAHPVRPAYLRFVDADTEREIPSARIRTIRDDADTSDRSESHPEDVEPAGMRCTSPFEVDLFADDGAHPHPGWIGMRRYAIAAEGYARQDVWIDPSEGGTRTFELEREARLRLIVPADRDRSLCAIVLARDGDARIWRPRSAVQWLTISGGSKGSVTTVTRHLEFRNLPAGDWTVRVDPRTVRAGCYFAPVRMQLVAGSEVEVRLDGDVLPVTDVRVRARVELRGTVQLPPDVDASSLRLRFVPGPEHPDGQHAIEDLPGYALARDPREPGLFHWYAGVVPAGRWIAQVSELGWSHELEVEDGARIALVAERIDATVEPPGSPRTSGELARFRVIDGATREPLEPDRLDVRAALVMTPGVWDAAERCWSIPATAGVGRVALQRRDDPAIARAVEVSAGPEVATVELWPPLWVEIRAYDGDARIGAPELERDAQPLVESIGPSAGKTFPSVGRERWNLYRELVPAPGRYRVTLPPNPRYAAHPPVEVEVRAGAPTPVAVFRLARAER